MDLYRDDRNPPPPIVRVKGVGRQLHDGAYCVLHDVRLYSVLDTVAISGEDVCCSMVLALWLVCLCLVLCGLSF